MTFELAGNGGNCLGCEWIAAEGVITQDTPAEFEKFLKSYAVRSPAVTVVLHSRGGDVEAGIRLGRIIREANLSTGVGRTVSSANDWRAEEVPGHCLSSCAYVFLGGVNRWVDEDDTLGFHQFLPTNENVRVKMDALGREFDLSTSQVWTGLLAAYFQELDINTALLAVASATPFDSMYVPTMRELREFGVVKPQEIWSEWDLTYIEGGIALDAERRHSISPEKARLVCFGNDVVFFSVQDYPSTLETPSEIREMMTLDPSIRVGGVEREINPLEVIVSRDGDMLFLGVHLTKKEVQRLRAGGGVEFDFGTPRGLFGTFMVTQVPAVDPAPGKIDLMLRNCPR